MAPISSTSGSQAATQVIWQQLKLQQAERNADQAEQTARDLKAEANSAQKSADHAQERADSLSSQSSQAENIAGQARQGLAAIKSLEVMQTQLDGAYTKIGQALKNTGVPAAPLQPPPQAAAGTQEPVSGTVVDLTV